MRNPLQALATRQHHAASSVPISSRFQLPVSSVNLFTRADAELQIDTMRTNGTVHSVVHRLSADVASLAYCVLDQPLGAKVSVDDPDARVPDHAFLRLWDRPNERMTPTGRAFRQLSGLYLELLGEAAILVVSRPNTPTGQPVELYPIRPDRLKPIPHPYQWLAGWVYTSEDGEAVPLRPDQIIQVKYPDPSDPYRGLSPLRAAMVDVDTSSFANEWQRQFFQNSALPGGMVVTDDELTSTDFATWVERWNEQHQGVSNAGRVALMDRSAKWVSQQMSMVDMQLAELVLMNRGGIREAFGISKTILGQNEDVNRATALAAQQIYGRYSMKDRADLWTEAGNEVLARFPSSGARPGRPARLRVAIDGDISPEDTELAAKDRDSRVKAVFQLVQQGADLVATAEAFGLPELIPAAADGSPDPKALAELVQKLYLGVGSIITADEGRALLADAGFPLGEVPLNGTPIPANGTPIPELLPN